MTEKHYDEVDWDFLGIYPDEAYGVSNMGRLSGKPQFTEAEFQVNRASEGRGYKTQLPLNFVALRGF